MPSTLIAKATAALQEAVSSIVNCTESDTIKRAALVETFGQFQDYMAKSFAGDEPDRRNDGNVGASGHRASQVADLLVESGSHPDRSAALDYLMHSPHGAALLSRTSKAAEQTEKESNMRTSETLESILKDGGPVSVCKAIVDRGRSPCGEHELVAALTKRASELRPEIRPDQAFSKLFEGEESVRRAIGIAKATPWVEPIRADIAPLVVGGVAATHEAIDSTESSEAYAQLQALGQQRWPNEQSAIQFSRAFEARPDLAAKAHRRPVAPAGGIYPYPR